MKDPLLVMAFFVGTALIIAVTAMFLGKPVNDALVGVLSTALGGLITAVSTRNKEKKQIGQSAQEESNEPE